MVAQVDMVDIRRIILSDYLLLPNINVKKVTVTEHVLTDARI